MLVRLNVVKTDVNRLVSFAEDSRVPKKHLRMMLRAFVGVTAGGSSSLPVYTAFDMP